jgi:hypothetical protein
MEIRDWFRIDEDGPRFVERRVSRHTPPRQGITLSDLEASRVDVAIKAEGSW